MKNIKLLSMLSTFLLLISCATTVETSRISIFSGYKKVFSKDLGSLGTLTEIIPANESKDNWTKMFTIQLMQGAPYGPKKSMEIFVKRASKNCGNKFISKIISETKNSVTFEWTVENCKQIDNMKYISPYIGITDCNINYFTGHIWYGSRKEQKPSNCNKTETQTEIVRFMQGKEGLHRVAFTQKSNKITGKTRNHWLTNLKKSYVVNGGKKVIIE